MSNIKFKNSIFSKFIVILLLFSLIPILSFNIIGLKCINETIEKSYLEKSTNEIMLSEKAIEEYIISIKEDLAYIKNNINVGDSLGKLRYYYDKVSHSDLTLSITNMNQEEKKIYKYFQGYGNTHLKYEYIHLSFNSGEFLLWPETKLPEKYDPRNRIFYQDAMKNKGEIVVTDPYCVENSNLKLLTVTTAIEKNGEYIGVLGIDTSLDIMSDIMAKMKIADKGYLILVDKNGTIIADSKNKENNYKSINNVIKGLVDIENINSGVFEVEEKDKKYIAKVESSNNMGWKFIAMIPKDDIFLREKSTQQIISAIGMLSLIFTIILVIIIAKKVSNPINIIMGTIQNIKDGKYTDRCIYNKSDEFGLISRSLNDMGNEINRANNELTKLAFKDVNLNVYNRRKFIKDISEAIERKDEGIIISLDIDDFKCFNDTFGIKQGDILLENMVIFLKRIVLSNEVYRLGGDEFAIILRGYSREDAVKVVDRIFNRMNHNWIINDVNYICSVSIAMVSYGINTINVDETISNLAYTLSEVKTKGKNKFIIFGDELKGKIRYKNNIVEILKTAIEKEKYMVYYQPIYNLEEKKFTKVECLIRLYDKDMGFISPMEFIPIAEETGYINEIGLFVLDNVCKKIRDFSKEHTSIKCFNVNISAAQIIQENFVYNVREIIETYNIKPEMLEFEITESILINSFDTVKSIMNELSNIGIKFAIDDFGTGYSSLNYLLQLPISTLKIDRSFILQGEKNDNSRIMLKNIINMGKELDMQIIAEGVETEEQLKILQILQCNNIQGYYFSKPLSTEDINEYLK